MLKEFKYNVKYILNKKEFYFTLLIFFAISLIHVFLCINESLRLNQFYEEFFTGEYQFILYNINVNFQTLLIIIVPIVSGMILSDASVIENKSKMTNLLFTRINYKKNIIVRCIMCFMVTMLLCVISFLFNYIVLRFIYGSGNYITYAQDVAFDLKQIPSFFLDDIRIINPTLFAILITICVSIIYGLLSALSYAISLFIKNRVVIYFIPIVLLVLTDMVLNKIGLSEFSINVLLQPFGAFGMVNFLICAFCLFAIITILVIVKLRKKDVIL